MYICTSKYICRTTFIPSYIQSPVLPHTFSECYPHEEIKILLKLSFQLNYNFLFIFHVFRFRYFSALTHYIILSYHPYNVLCIRHFPRNFILTLKIFIIFFYYSNYVLFLSSFRYLIFFISMALLLMKSKNKIIFLSLGGLDVWRFSGDRDGVTFVVNFCCVLLIFILILALPSR